MNRRKIRCREVRERLQELHDRGAAGLEAELAAGAAVRDHLGRCARCREFSGFLAALPAELGRALEQGIEGASPGTRPGRRSRRRVRPALRWALAAAASLVAAALALGTLERYSTDRGVRAEVARLLEDLYAEPLLAGAESALSRSRGGLSEYLEAYGAESLDWLEGSAVPPLPD